MARYIVIGGSSGIGESLLQQLVSKGHEVFALCRSEVSTSGVTYFTCEVSTGSFPELEGPIHGLVYCPGSINLKPLRQLKVEDFQKDFEVNCLGAVKAVKAYLPLLKSSQNASLVFFSTVAVQRGMAFHASVAAAKGAVEGMSRSLAAELAPEIRVNCIAPSLTETPLSKALIKGRDTLEQRHPLKRLGQPGDIASMAAFLLSEEASWITGQVIGVDGGLAALSVF